MLSIMPCKKKNNPVVIIAMSPSCLDILSAEPIKRATLSLERIDDVERGDGLALGVFGVGDCVADDGFEEGFQDAAGFFVDHCLRMC